MTSDSSTTVATDPLAKPPCAFYSVCDSRFFPGMVALLNSLRLIGHDERIFLVDAGLTAEQRRLLSDHVTLISAPQNASVILLKQLGPMKYPASVSILLDADIIVTRPLTELVAAARSGRIVAFVDQEATEDRFFPEWSSLLGFEPLRRQPYLNGGQLVIPDSLRHRLLELWVEGQAKVDAQQTWHGKGSLSSPLYFGDQDVLNALVATHFEPDEMMILEHRLAPFPPFPGLRLIDERRILCRYADGTQPFLLHHILAKPWLKTTRTTVYSLLLPRLLLAPDVALRLESDQLPLRLREGRLAVADRRRANLQALIYSHSRRQLGRFGIRTRIAGWRRSRELDPV
jgi:hypothetical protein